MMGHKDIERLIQKNLDHKIKPEEQQIINRHLSECSPCQQFYQGLSRVEQELGGLIEFFPRRDFNSRVLVKLGFEEAVIWTKVAMVFAGAWLASLLFLVFSPLKEIILSRILLFLPEFIRLFEKSEFILSTIGQVLISLAKAFINPTGPIAGLILGLLTLYFFSRIIKKEEQWVDSNI